jgi:hypothetical protein
MKSLINFYMYISWPFLTMVLLAKAGLLSGGAFMILVLTYALVYHPLISGLRLVATNKIPKDRLWLTFIPFWNWRYFSYLFFNKD